MISQQSKRPEQTQPKPEQNIPLPTPVNTTIIQPPEKTNITQPQKTEKPIITQPQKPETISKPTIITPQKIPATPKPYEPAHGIDIEEIIDEVKKNAEKHKHKDKNVVKPHDVESVTVEPIPQDKPDEPNKEIVTDVMGFDPKYDGLKMKDKTMPWSKVAKGAAMGTLGAATVIIAGKDLISNALSMGGAGIGYHSAGEEGAYIGGLAGAAGGRRINVGSGSSGGSMTMTQERAPMGRGRPIVPRPAVPTGPATSIGRLASALQNIQPDTRPPVQQQIR